LNDGRRKEALDAIESATVEHTQFLDGWLLRSHLHLVADQFDKGLVSLRSAKSAFDEKNATPKQRTDFYQRSGELIGYLQGPAGSRVDQKLLNSVIEHLMAGAADPDIATFRAATDQIRQKFIERQQSTQARLDAELQKQAAADAIQQDTLTARNQNLILNEQALRDRQSQLRHDLGQRESQLTSQLSPLHNNLVGLESQITAVQRNLQYLHSDLARAQNQSPVCPITVRAILDQVNRAEINLYTLQTNHQSYVMQLQTVQSQIQSTRAQYNDQLNEIQRELKRIGNSLNRNRNQLTRLAEGPKVASGKKEAGANRVTSLGSYVKLSPELIRQQLLESVK
jgi:DNA repair exonuclease SbcCD ATPase subunit